MRSTTPILVASALTLIVACKPAVQSQPVELQQPVVQSVPRLDARMADSVITMFGDVEGRLVADLFAKDGYYTMELLDAGAKVIAIDTDAGLLEVIRKTATERGFGPDRLETRLVTPGDPGVSAGEVNHALCTTTYLNIPDRSNFFTQVHAALKKGGQLIVVDRLDATAPDGRPVRITDEVMDELQPCGFSDLIENTMKIPERFIIQATEITLPPPE